MKRNILVPTDFSDNAWSAAQYALKLYTDEECTFYFLNSHATPHGSSTAYMTTKLTDILKQNSKRDLNSLKAKAEENNRNATHDFKVIATAEDLIPAINRAVQKYKIDLVVTGTKGASGVSKYFLGSNTVKVIQNLKYCPILTVPKEQEFKIPKHIAFPTDFKRAFENKEVTALLDFVELFKAHLYVVHVNSKESLNDIQEENMRALQNRLEDFQHTFHWLPKSTTKSDEISDFIEDLNIDMLAMVNYKHSFIEGLINEPIIKNIGFKPTVPFLVIPE